jgi:hypothetical protein
MVAYCNSINFVYRTIQPITLPFFSLLKDLVPCLISLIDPLNNLSTVLGTVHLKHYNKPLHCNYYSSTVPAEVHAMHAELQRCEPCRGGAYSSDMASCDDVQLQINAPYKSYGEMH